MARPRNPVPRYELHKKTGLARVRSCGRKVWLGKHGTPESLADYARVCAEIGATAKTLAAPPAVASVNELLVAFARHAERRYRGPDGEPTTEIHELKWSLKPVRELYGTTPTAPAYRKFLDTVIPHPATAEYVRRSSGYAATGDATDETLHLFHGTGPTGRGSCPTYG